MLCALCAFCVITSLFGLFGCKRDENGDGSLKIVCTAFPQYDWIKNITGGDGDFAIKLLVENGSDIHSYQPTVADRVRIAECDILVTVGGESDSWVEEMLVETEGVALLRLFDAPNITLNTVSEDGILAEHTHGEHNGEHGEHHEHGAYDEHMWLSVKNAIACVKYLSNEISKLAPDKEQALNENSSEYISRLCELDKELTELCSGKENKGLLFADRFPFAYLTADYGLEYCAAFSGCSTENSADFETVTRLARRADEWNSKYILVTEGSDKRLANSVIAAAKEPDIAVLSMDSMQSVTRSRIDGGESYISVMHRNLDTLRVALS